MFRNLAPTSPDYLAYLNSALKEAGLRVQATAYVAGTRCGSYTTDRFITTRGSHILVNLYTNVEHGVFLKSVCSVRNKRSPASLLVNGQACTNTKDLIWFRDLEGPAIPGAAKAA